MNEWNLVALTYDTEMIRLYVDGEMVNEKEVGEPDAAYLGGKELYGSERGRRPAGILQVYLMKRLSLLRRFLRTGD